MSDFDPSLELDVIGSWVAGEMAAIDMVIESYPNLTDTMEATRADLLSDPSAAFARKAESMRVAHERFPALAKIMMEE